MCRIWRPPRNSIFVRSKLLLQVISLWLIFTLRIDVYALRDLMGHCYVHFAFLFTLNTSVLEIIRRGRGAKRKWREAETDECVTALTLLCLYTDRQPCMRYILGWFDGGLGGSGGSSFSQPPIRSSKEIWLDGKLSPKPRARPSTYFDVYFLASTSP